MPVNPADETLDPRYVSQLKRLWRFSVTTVVVIAVAFIIYINIALYNHPTFARVDGTEVNEDLLKQLTFLQHAIERNRAEDMQQVYPEGYVFMMSLYGLAWADVAKQLPASTELHQRAQHEVDVALQALQSPYAQAIFPEELPLPRGAYYCGWTNYLLAKKLSATPPSQRTDVLIAKLTTGCDAIASAFNNQESPYLESYHELAWPADNAMAIAALAVYDKTFEPRYRTPIARWVGNVKTHVDELGMIPHSAIFKTGTVAESARGSSMSLMLTVLPEIDPAFAKQQFKLYTSHFLDRAFGLPGVREYPIGNFGVGDVDSGPVVVGIGGAASIVAIRACYLNGDQHTSEILRTGINAFGLPWSSNGEKKYFFGVLPIADAFIAWSNSTTVVKERYGRTSDNWRLRFQLYSFLITAILFFIAYRLWRKKNRPSEKVHMFVH